MQSASDKPPKLCSKKFALNFDTDKIWNTPYSVITGPREQSLIKEELPPTVEPFKHNGSISIGKVSSRPPFIDKRKGPHDARFSLLDTFDKSDYLTKVRRTKMNLTFTNYSPRDPDLLRKCGVEGVDLGSKQEMIYNTDIKEKYLKRLDTVVRDFTKTVGVIG